MQCSLQYFMTLQCNCTGSGGISASKMPVISVLYVTGEFTTRHARQPNNFRQKTNELLKNWKAKWNQLTTMTIFHTSHSTGRVQ